MAEKTQCSADNARFTRYKEGLFYKCQNEDAMIFVERVKIKRLRLNLLIVLEQELSYEV